MLKMIRQVRRNPSRWIRRRNTTLISECQDCHTQLWKKQNISRVQELVQKGSKIILIEQHFKPICSRITSTIHSSTFRRRSSANWVMRSYSSCAKLHQKYNVPNVLVHWNQGIVVLPLADTAWFTTNPEESWTNWDWMHSLSRIAWSRKALPMVLDTARPKYKESTVWPGMRGRDAVRNSTPKVNIPQVFTIDFSEIQFIVNHNSQSDGQNQSAKSGMILAKEDTWHTKSSRGKEKTQRTMVRQNWAVWSFDLITEPLSWWNIAYTTNQGEPIEEPIHPGQQSRKGQGQEVFSEGCLSSARVDQHTEWQYWPSFIYKFPRGGTHPYGVGSELTIFFARVSFFVTVGFVYSW